MQRHAWPYILSDSLILIESEDLKECLVFDITLIGSNGTN